MGGALLTKHVYLKKKLEQLISEQIKMHSEHLSMGSPPDYAAYMRLVGKIDGLRSALDLCDEAEKLMERET